MKKSGVEGHRFGLIFFIIVSVVIAGGFVGTDSFFAPRSYLWPYWEAHNPANQVAIDHETWNRLLARYLAEDEGGIARFDYGAVTEADRHSLDEQISAWAELSISDYRRDQQLAYWINLYNALTVAVVLDHYPVASIKDIDISPGLFASGPWDGEVVTVESKALTLNDIEHRILRPVWRDARIHYAVNCASVGCPNLASVSYTVKNIEVMLDEAARAYINHPRGISVTGDEINVSRIYSWYVDDFGGDAAGVLSHVRKYASPALFESLKGLDMIDGVHYDWALNDAK
ncbi:MAG: DUF547 domain-containing protein [Parvularculales bacterium]